MGTAQNKGLINFTYSSGTTQNQSGNAYCPIGTSICNANILGQTNIPYTCTPTSVGYTCNYTGGTNAPPTFICSSTYNPALPYNCATPTTSAPVVTVTSGPNGNSVTWTPVTTALSYNVTRTDNLGNTITIASNTTNTTISDNNNLQACTQYSYTVIAQTNNGNLSSTPTPLTLFNCAAPSSVILLQPSNAPGTSTVLLQWNAIGSDLNFNILRQVNGGAQNTLATGYNGNFDGTYYNYTDINAPNGNLVYQIVAFNPSGNSGSNTSGVTVNNSTPPNSFPLQPLNPSTGGTGGGGGNGGGTDGNSYIIIAIVVMIIIIIIAGLAFWWYYSKKKAKTTKSVATSDKVSGSKTTVTTTVSKPTVTTTSGKPSVITPSTKVTKTTVTPLSIK